MTSIGGVVFGEAWKDRVKALISEMSTPALTRKLLVQNKLASGRPKDLIDLVLLEEAEKY